MNQTDWAINDSSRQLLKPNLHDGILTGIRIVAEGQVLLTFKDTLRFEHILILDQVVDFVANSFRKGNSVLDVTIIRGEEINLDDLILFGPRDQFQNELSILREKIRRENLYVLQLNPSYGCELIGVAKDVRLLKGNADVLV